MTVVKSIAIALALVALPAIGQAQTTDKKALTLDGAKRVASAAAAEARRNHAGGAIAVVDDGGNLMYLERLDGTFVAGSNISIGKARTAAIFKRETKFFEDVIKGGRTSMVALSDFTPLQGGVPIVVDEQVVGGIGVSGAMSAQQDEEIARAGANAVTAGSAAIHYFPADQVAAAFATGAELLDGGDGRNYMVHASRREKAGMAEAHVADTDVIYVTGGAATFVTGGGGRGRPDHRAWRDPRRRHPWR